MTPKEKPLFIPIDQYNTLVATAERFVNESPPETDDAVDLIMHGLLLGETWLARAILSWAGIDYTVAPEAKEPESTD